MSKELVCTKEIQCNNKNNTKMFKFDFTSKEDIKEHNANWRQFPDHPYKILIVGGSGSVKTNVLINL